MIIDPLFMHLADSFVRSQMTPQELAISDLRIGELVYEYNLIQRKESRCSRTERDMIVVRINRMVAKGDLVKMENGDVSTKIIVRPKKT